MGAVLPDPGTYEFVFDTPTGAKPGAFTFRFWVERHVTAVDPAPRPQAHARAAAPLSPSTTRAPGSTRSRSTRSVGGQAVPLSYTHGVLSLPTKGLRPGRTTLVVTASDYQETKNMEDVGPVLPNTRILRTTVTLRRYAICQCSPSR